MEEDNLYPSDGTYMGGVPLEPRDQRVARRKERANTLEALPVLKDLVNQLEFDIAFYGTVDSIPPEVKTDPEKFLIMHNANELVRDVLQSKKEYIEELIETHARNKI